VQTNEFRKKDALGRKSGFWGKVVEKQGKELVLFTSSTARGRTEDAIQNRVNRKRESRVLHQKWIGKRSE